MRVAVTGPESSGKTTLTKALAEAINWVPVYEFAREYLSKIEGKYELQDLDEIAEGHYNQIQEVKQNTIVDTDFIVMKVWSDVRFGETSEYIQRLIAKDLFDLHIVCLPDIPWEPDPLRENPDDRDVLLDHYLKELKNARKVFISVSGTHQERMTKALKEISKLLPA